MTTVFAQAASEDTGSPWFSLLFFGAIFGAMYFLLLRPQRRRLKESQALQRSLAEGDEVVLNSGLIGFVSAVEGDIVWVDIADGHGQERIEVRVLRSAIARRTPGETGAAKN
jgi:preprotein translocase subunit YajC